VRACCVCERTKGVASGANVCGEHDGSEYDYWSVHAGRGAEI
jgi:hypothetical protein